MSRKFNKYGQPKNDPYRTRLTIEEVRSAAKTMEKASVPKRSRALFFDKRHW